MSNIKKIRKQYVGQQVTSYETPEQKGNLSSKSIVVNVQAVVKEGGTWFAWGEVEDVYGGATTYVCWEVEAPAQPAEPEKKLESLGDHHQGADREGGKNHRVESKIINGDADLDLFLKEEQLDFTVAKYQEKSPFTGDLRNSWGCYRTDNNHIFKTGLGATFKPFQNRDAFQAIADLSKVGEVKTARAGVWNGGAETFIQVDLNGGLPIGGNPNDVVTQRVSYINRNDGDGSARIFLTPYRPTCRNQLTTIRSVAKKAEQQLRIRHTQSGEALLLKLSEEWGIIDDAFKATQEHFNLLADTKINKGHVAEVLNRIAPVFDGQSKRLKDANHKKQLGIAQFVSNADDGFIAWDTAWNLINAITRYTTHVQTGFSNKEKSLLVGSGRDANFDALDLVNEVCGVEL